MPTMPRVFNQAEAHSLLNECGVTCSHRAVRRWFTERKLPVYKSALDGRLYVSQDDLLSFIDGRVHSG